MAEIIISLTVTDLDNFRRYREDEEMTLPELLARLRREEGPSDVMRAGSAFHSILEHPDADEMTWAERDGHRFFFPEELEIALLPFREIPAKRTYNIAGQQVELRGRTDGCDGFAVEDHKFTTNTFDAERYFDKYQWRAYLSIFGARIFYYNVFPAKFLETDANGVMNWEIREFHRLPLYRYPEMEADIVRELAAYADFAHQHLIAPSRAA